MYFLCIYIRSLEEVTIGISQLVIVEENGNRNIILWIFLYDSFRSLEIQNNL